MLSLSRHLQGNQLKTHYLTEAIGILSQDALMVPQKSRGPHRLHRREVITTS